MPNKSTVDVTAAKLYNDIKADLAFNREMKPMWFSNLAHPNSLDCLHYRLAVYCDLPGWRRARGLVGARCDVTQRSALALSTLASRAPGAPEPVPFFMYGPPGHASPCTVRRARGLVGMP